MTTTTHATPIAAAAVPAARTVDVPAAAAPLEGAGPTVVDRAPIGSLAAICGVAFLARLAAMLMLRAWQHPNAMEHRSIAASLVRGTGFAFNDWHVAQLTSVQSPPYPFLLATFFAIFGAESPAAYAGAIALNAVVGALTCLILYATVRACRGSPRVALLAAALLAVWPTQVYATTVAQAITIITACTVAIVGLFYRSVETRRVGPWIAFGLIGCVAALTEPVLLPFMALSGLIILAWRELPVATRVRNAAILFGCAVLVLAPWTIRNVRVHGKVVPVKSTFWVNMWKGNNEHASGTDRPVLTEIEREAYARGQIKDVDDADNVRQYNLLSDAQRAELTGRPEVEREAIFGRYAKDYIRSHPAGYARLCAIRLWKTLWVEADNPKAHGLQQYVLYWTPRTILLLLTPFGLVLAWRRGWRLVIPITIAAIALLTHTLTIAAARFAFPYEPFQIALVALILVTLADRRLNRDGRLADVEVTNA